MEDLLGELSNSSTSGCDVNATMALHSHWIYVSFGDCVLNVRQYCSFFVGLTSLVFNICAQLPQIVVNCKTGEADKSLSFWFLLLWLISDSCNFIGAILTKQLITQVILAAYFVFIDLVTVTQFCLHYFQNQGLKLFCARKKKNRNSKCNPEVKYESLNTTSVTMYMTVLVFLLPSVVFLCGSSAPSDMYYSSKWKGRALLESNEKIIDTSDKEFLIGYILGWISAVVNFFALPPQIIKNFARRSASGVSLMMFVFLTMGNLTYTLSVLLFSVDKVFIIRTLPWIVLGGWSIVFDVFWLYGMEDLLGELSNSSTSGCDVNATMALHSHWIYVSFGDCVLNVRQYCSFFVGLISLVFWIFAQFPQIVVNCKTGEADKSLSFWFLLLWLFSDSCNFIGAILTNQLITQVLVAAYFVFIDLVSLIQFCLHYFRNQGLKEIKQFCSSKKKNCPKCSYGRMSSGATVNMVALVFLLPSVVFLCGSSASSDMYYSSKWKGRALLESNEKIIDTSDKEFLIGYILGWISAVVYFFALPPQIIKNFVRKSATGLSLLMFVFVTMGDFTYTLSVLLFSVDTVFIIRTLPWIVGSGWSLIFDVFLVIQISIYKYRDYTISKELTTLSKETTV